METRKRFNRSLYDTYDQKAKTTVLKHMGPAWRENEDRVGPDLINVVDSAYIECEVKTVWKGEEFQYNDIQLPKRKGKWKDLNIHYFVLNEPCTRAIVIPAAALKVEYLREVPNRYVWKGEYFYGIPLTECEFVDLKEFK